MSSQTDVHSVYVGKCTGAGTAPPHPRARGRGTGTHQDGLETPRVELWCVVRCVPAGAPSPRAARQLVIADDRTVARPKMPSRKCSLFVYDVQCFLLNTRDSKNIRKPIREIGLNANRRRLHLNNTLQQDRNLLWRREGSNYILNTFTGMEKI